MVSSEELQNSIWHGCASCQGTGNTNWRYYEDEPVQCGLCWGSGRVECPRPGCACHDEAEEP